MATRRAIVDTGPLVALLDRGDQFHAWSVEVLRSIRAPLVTCEAVLTEAMFLVRRRPDAQDALLEMVSKGLLRVAFALQAEVEAVRQLRRRYESVPMSVADACLVRMAEQLDDHRVCTVDSDFTIYRKHGRQPIPLLMPASR